jgi:hypothetical protein
MDELFIVLAIIGLSFVILIENFRIKYLEDKVEALEKELTK